MAMDILQGYQQQLSREGDQIPSNDPLEAVWVDKRLSGSSSQNSPIKRSSYLIADDTNRGMEEKRAAFHSTMRLGREHEPFVPLINLA